jgi:hypothetical protein
MKKLLLSLSLMISSFFLFGQSLSLTHEGEPVEPNSTVYVMGDPTDDIIQVFIDVTNNSSADLSIKMKKVIEEGDTLTGTSNYFCWGACFPSYVYVSPNEIVIAAGQTSSDFYGDYEPREISGKSRIGYCWWDVNNPDDSVSVTVEYNASPTGISDPAFVNVTSKVYPNPATIKVNFNYDLPQSTKTASIVISNILGSKVMEIPLNGNEGTVAVNVSDLRQGVYFYNLIANGERVDTQKLIINN